MMLRNHGTLALGGSVGSCFMRLYYIERACKIQVGAMNGTLNMPPGAIDMIPRSTIPHRGRD